MIVKNLYDFELSFDDLMIINKWTKKYILELKNIEKELCPCKIKIIKLKWDKIIYWFNETSLRMARGEDLLLEDIVMDVKRIIGEYEDEIFSDAIISKKIYSIFRELHKVTTTEFLDIINELIERRNKHQIELLDYIDEFGKALYGVLLNSIFEIHEIFLKCENTECSYRIKDGSPERIKFLINDMYNINSYSEYKLNKFIDIIGVDTKNIDFIADFKYLDDKSVSPKMIKMLSSAKEKFKSLSIINVNKHVASILKESFPKEISHTSLL